MQNGVNDFRFNFSHDGEALTRKERAIGGSVPLPRDLVIPAEYDSAYASGYFNLNVPGTSLYGDSAYAGTGTVQHQYQVVDSLVWTRGAHSLKFGGDWRRLTPTYTSQSYSSDVNVGSLADIQQGYATEIQVSAAAPGQPVFDNLSLYAQDNWKISPKLSLDYGVRWEFNPPPGPSNGRYPVALTSGDIATATLAPLGTPPYKATYDHFAPRLGFAWNPIPSAKHAFIVRGGFGIFYDTGQSVIGNAYVGAYPFSATGPTLNEVPMPLTASALAPPSLNVPLTPPYPFLNDVSDPNLTLPYTEQWNLSVDTNLNARNTFTVSYVGNAGRKLLFTEGYGYGNVPINPDFTNLFVTRNASQSSYNALQVQDRGKVVEGLDLVGSFTWAHARDDESSDFGHYAPVWGNSDNDLRVVLNLALNYQIPTVDSNRWTRALTHGWLIANRFSAQSGIPENIIQSNGTTLPNGAYVQIQPDLVPGVPIYLHGSAADLNGQPVPGNWRLNPAAFSLVPVDENGNPIRMGTLGRNYIRNPPFWTLNTALQRSFPVHERLHLIFRVDAFNILNHPSYGNFDNYLSDSTFGQTRGVTTIGTTNVLYAMGAARSLQVSLKLQF